MKYSKLKKKLLNIDFVNKLLRSYGEQEKDLNSFKTFECSSFFRGDTLAKLNQEIYDKKIKIVYIKVEILDRIKERIEENRRIGLDHIGKITCSCCEEKKYDVFKKITKKVYICKSCLNSQYAKDYIEAMNLL